MGRLSYKRYETEFETETTRLGAIVARAEPDAPVPTCPEWTMRDLVTHVGKGHRWSAEVVEGRLQQPPPQVDMTAPEDPREWAAWLTAGARRLANAVREVGVDEAVWTWQSDHSAGFWVRRMLHDEIVHRFDAELAGGRLGELATDLAADGVSDMLDTAAALSPPGGWRSDFGALAGDGETLHLHATDPGLGEAGEWFVQRTPAGVMWRYGHARADVAVRGPARELLLVLNRRLDPADTVEVVGDATLFAHWLDHSRF